MSELPMKIISLASILLFFSFSLVNELRAQDKKIDIDYTLLYNDILTDISEAVYDSLLLGAVNMDKSLHICMNPKVNKSDDLFNDNFLAQEQLRPVKRYTRNYGELDELLKKRMDFSINEDSTFISLYKIFDEGSLIIESISDIYQSNNRYLIFVSLLFVYSTPEGTVTFPSRYAYELERKGVSFELKKVYQHIFYIFQDKSYFYSSRKL